MDLQILFLILYLLFAFKLSDSSYWIILVVINHYFSTDDNAEGCTTCIFIQLIFRRFWDQNRVADAVSVI